LKYIIEATVPTTQYGNIRPTFELEEDGDEALALEKLHALWAKYGEKPLRVSEGQIEGNNAKIERRTTFTGEEILWNESTHTYTDLQGNVLRSASQYANEHSPKFDMDMLLPKTAKAWEVDEAELRQIWKMNGDVSNQWGSVVHTALELYHNHHATGQKIKDKKELDDNYVLPKNSYLRRIVKEFVAIAGTDALCEVLVSDVANKMAGTIDRLVITGEKTCRIGDYKTNNEMDSKKLLKYQKQLSYYAHILINKGWTVAGLDIYYLNADDGWSVETLEVLPLE
jgi:hypothetical protein